MPPKSSQYALTHVVLDRSANAFTTNLATIEYATYMPSKSHSERREHTRELATGLLVSARRKGRLTRLQGIAVDFSRHGIGILIDQPLPKDATVYLSITGQKQHLDSVVGIVHNCTGQSDGFRCGIQFRTGSELQDEKAKVEARLGELEQELQQASSSER